MNKIINIDYLPEIFKVKDIMKVSKGNISRRMISYSVSKLVKDKKLIKISNGTYSKIGDAFYIGYKLYQGYVGFSSALYLHGLKNELEAVIYICTGSPRKQVRVMNKVIEPVNMSRNYYGTSMITFNNREILISTYAKTVFDMLSKPKYANYFDMYRAMRIRKLTDEEWKELIYYSKNSNLTDIRRIGYATEGIAPRWFTKELNNLSMEGYRTSFFFKHSAENYNSKWSIFDDLSMRRWLDAI